MKKYKIENKKYSFRDDVSISMENEFIKDIKDGIFTIAIDDSMHQRGDPYTGLFFIFCRGPYIENVMKSRIQVDGLDATDVIISALTPFKEKFQILLTHGMTTGGLNLLDIEKISEMLQRPVLSITENAPKGDDFLKAIEILPNIDERKAILHHSGQMESVELKFGTVYYYRKGLSRLNAVKFIKKFAIRSKLPEQLLLAHKIASALDCMKDN